MDHKSDMFRNFKDHRSRDVYCDITIQIGAEQFRCHKLMLSSASNYFEILFTKEMSKNQSKFKIETISAEAFATCLDFIYTGKCSFLDMADYYIEEILYAADLF